MICYNKNIQITAFENLHIYLRSPYSVPVDVPYRRPNRLTYEVETWHVATSNGCAGFRPYEAGLRGHRGRPLV